MTCTIIELIRTSERQLANEQALLNKIISPLKVQARRLQLHFHWILEYANCFYMQGNWWN